MGNTPHITGMDLASGPDITVIVNMGTKCAIAFCSDPRQAGKTTKSVQFAHEHGFVMLCRTQEEAERIERLSRKIGTPIEATTWEALKNGLVGPQ